MRIMIHPPSPRLESEVYIRFSKKAGEAGGASAGLTSGALGMVAGGVEAAPSVAAGVPVGGGAAIELGAIKGAVVDSASVIEAATQGLPEVVGASGVIIADGAHVALMEWRGGCMRALAPDVARLRMLFDNTKSCLGDMCNKFVKIDYEHILGIEFLFNRKGLSRISGFHHDLMHVIENSGMVKFVNKAMGPGGTYKADLVVFGKRFPKTFFPAHWSRRQVIEAILEAYEYQITCSPGKNGTYTIVGKSQSGIEITMHMTQNGRITTAYPGLDYVLKRRL